MALQSNETDLIEDGTALILEGLDLFNKNRRFREGIEECDTLITLIKIEKDRLQKNAAI